MNEEQKAMYTEFVRAGVAAGFTDDQVNFMWDFVMMSVISAIKMKGL